MSIQKTKDGGRKVRWLDETGRHRSKTFPKGQAQLAEVFDGKIKERKLLGDLSLLDLGKQTLGAYVTETWAPAHLATKAPKTRKLYTYLYDAHIDPALGNTPLRALNPEMIARWQADLVNGGVGQEAVRKAHTLLGGILQRAAESRRISYNPARLVPPLAAPEREEVRPLAPETVELLRHHVRYDEKGSERQWGHRNATLISLLAYSGVRPQEARGLRWENVRDATLLVHSPKTRRRGRRSRTVRLLSPLKSDLAQWRLASGRPPDRAWVFPGEDGEQRTEYGYQQWRGRTWKAVLERAKLAYQRPYDLRHSFASLLLHEGRSVIYVARQLGHGAQLTSNTYGHVIDELEDQPRVSAEEAIRAARLPSDCLRVKQTDRAS
jgi:integrase